MMHQTTRLLFFNFAILIPLGGKKVENVSGRRQLDTRRAYLLQWHEDAVNILVILTSSIRIFLAFSPILQALFQPFNKLAVQRHFFETHSLSCPF